MEPYFKIIGGNKLTGTIDINGAKNSILALLIGATMTDEVVTIEDVPNIKDVRALKKIFRELGMNIIVDKNSKRSSIVLDNQNRVYKDLYMDEIAQFRASYYFLGAMLGKYGKCNLLLPGGCFLGPRPIDLHIKGFEQLGCVVEQIEEADQTKIMVSAPNGLIGNHIFLDFPSVGATINIMLAASMAKGETIIENAAKEPEIVDLATMLNNMGANIKGAGTGEIKIVGVEQLNGCVHQTVPDRIEAGTYLMIGAALGEDLTITNIIPEHLDSLISKLVQMGVNMTIGDDFITINDSNKILKPFSIKTGVYPSYPTDLQQVYVTLLTQCEGDAIVTETIYPDRFRHCPYLNDMGANIEVQPGEELSKANVFGPTKLVGKEVYATDLRAGAALIFAGLIAEGETRVSNINHVLRGYDQIIEKLTNVGANISLIEEEI